MIHSCVLIKFLFSVKFYDRAERHELKSQLWLFFSPFLFPPKKRRKKKRRINSKNCDQKPFYSIEFEFYEFHKLVIGMKN